MPSGTAPDNGLPLYDRPALGFNLSAREAAKLLGISPRTLWTLTNAGEVPHVRLGRRLLYPRPLLEKWIMDRAESRRR